MKEVKISVIDIEETHDLNQLMNTKLLEAGFDLRKPFTGLKDTLTMCYVFQQDDSE